MSLVANQPGAEDEDKKKEQGGAVIGQPAPSAGLGAAPGGGSGVTTGQQAAGGPSKSGSFVDAGKFVEANRDNIAGLANRFTEKTSQQMAQGRQQIADSAKDYQQRIEAGRISADPFKGQRSDAIDVAGARNVLAGGYGGPAGGDIALAGVDALGAAKQRADLAQSYSGRDALLRDTFQNIQDYSQGERNLDNLLLTRDKATQQNLADASAGAQQQIDDARAQQDALRALAGTVAQDNQAQAQALGRQLQNEYAALSKGGGLDPMRRQQAIDAFVDRLLNAQQIIRAGTDQEQQGLSNREFDLGREITSGGGSHKSEEIARNIAAREFDALNAARGGNMLQGYSPAQEAQLRALQNITQGTDYGSIAQGAGSMLSRGAFNQDNVNQAILDYIREGGAAGRQTRRYGSSRWPT